MKGIRFRGHRVMGDIETLADRYRKEGADEIVFYDITASPEGRRVDRAWVERVAALLDIPFCVAGGIRSVSDAEEILAAGAEKVSINTPALENPRLIDQIAARFGRQCLVIGVDSLEQEGSYKVASHTGQPSSTRYLEKSTKDWVREVQDRGVGEIVLNCMNRDGVRDGYDVQHLADIREICQVPLVASGGAGREEHFRDVFVAARVDGALAATVFHSGAIPIPNLKRFLAGNGIEVRR